MWLEFIVGLIGFILIWDYVYKKKANDILKQSGINGPKPLPVLGNALDLKGMTTEGLIDFFKVNYKKYGKIHHMWVLHQLNVFIMDVEYLEQILSSQQIIKKSYLYDFLNCWLGTGLLLSTGKKWHTRRKIITPTFHFKILEQFVEIFDQQSSIMAEKLYSKADGKTAINLFPIVCLAALDIIAETAMGVKVNAQQNPNIEYVQALNFVAKVMANRFINPTKRTNWLFRLTSPIEARKTDAAIKIMHDFTNKVIQERRAILEKAIKDGTFTHYNENDEIGSKKRMALLDVLLQSTVNGAPLSNEDIREEVDTFMFEGHDTTTSAISFCLYLISRHADVQEKLLKEIHSVIGTEKQKPMQYRTLNSELKYLECVIKETLRLFPSVPAIGREAISDITLGDKKIPANTNLSLSLFMVLRDPEHFPDPDQFKPERFENESKINPFAYTPFSAGPRNCIGQKFAMLEMKSTVSKILRHFELLPMGEEARPMINLILRSANGVHIGLKPRI